VGIGFLLEEVDENILKLIVVIYIQASDYNANYSMVHLRRCTTWYVNYISIKLFCKK
jgi:hypothetical protein